MSEYRVGVGVEGGNKPQAELYSDLEKVRTRTGSGQKSGISALSFGDCVKNRLQGVRWEQEDPEAGLPRRRDTVVGVGHTQPCWYWHLEAQLVMGSLFPVSNGERQEVLYTEMRGQDFSSPGLLSACWLQGTSQDC